MLNRSSSAVIAVALLLAACKPQSSGSGSEPTVAAPVPAAPATGAISVPPEAESTSKLSRVMALDSIGATKEFLERSLGQSTYETPDEARYQVGGCQVSLAMADRAVSAVTIELAPTCEFDVAGLTGSDSPVMVRGPITFAQFERMFGASLYTAPCLSLCGNAYDPYVDAVVSGSRANGVIDIAANALFVSDAAIDAASAWRDKLTAKAGEEYVGETRFNCETTHNDIGRGAFASVNVERIQFGRSLGTDDCGP